MAKYGRAALTWTSTEDANTQRVFLLDVPLHDVVPGHTLATYYAESLDRTKTQTVTIGNGAYELEGKVRYASNPGGLIDVIKAGSQGKTLTYVPDLADPASKEAVILVSPRSPADLQLDGQRGFRGEAEVSLRFRRTDQKAMGSRARGSDVLFSYRAGDSLAAATFTRTSGARYPTVTSTADYGYGTLTTVAANKARLAWYSSVSSAGPRTIPALLLEPARTNLVKRSEAFGNWTKSVSTGQALSSAQADPAGGTNAWRFRSSASIAGGYVMSTLFTPSTFVVASAWFKQDIASTVLGRLRVTESTGAIGDVINIPFRFTSGVLRTTAVTKGALVAVERYRNGWYRLSGRTTAVVTIACRMLLNLPTPGSAGTTQGIYLYGAQVES